MREGFVDLCEYIPGIRAEIRYATSHNLTGHPLAGYDTPRPLATLPAAEALERAFAQAAQLGFGMLIYDAYRPQQAVNDFIAWAALPEDGLTKAEFYPEIDKRDLFSLGYIAARSGHSRGSTIDLTLLKDGLPVEMGTCFDYMGEASHHGYPALPEQMLRSRRLLRGIMMAAGFRDYENEWWHYTLESEPYPDTYFDFAIT